MPALFIMTGVEALPRVLVKKGWSVPAVEYDAAMKKHGGALCAAVGSSLDSEKYGSD